MPKEHRKRGKKKKSNAEYIEPIVNDPEEDSTQAAWMHTNDEQSSDAPFGYVDPDVKAYFRTVDAKLQEWQSADYSRETNDEEGNSNEDKRMFIVAALSESSGKEKQLATDPDCAIIIERMLHSMDDFVKRVFVDRLCGSYKQLAEHRFGSHVCQTLFEVAAGTISRETRGQVAKAPDSQADTGVLRTMTELVLTICEEILPSLSQLVLNPFAAHVVLSLLLLLSPTIAQPVDSVKRHLSLTRSKKSAAYKSRQGSMKSIIESNSGREVDSLVPASFEDAGRQFVDKLRDALDPNEVRALAADKIANPVLQGLVELEAKLGKSDSPGSLMDHTLMGAVSTLREGSQPEHSDYIETLLRDLTASHIFETLVRHVSKTVFEALWGLYFKGKLAKLSSHPVANFVVGKTILRLESDTLLEAMQEIEGVASKLVKTARTGVLKAVIDRSIALGAHQCKSNDIILQAVGLDTTQVQLFLPCLLALKTAKVYTRSAKSKNEQEAEDASNEGLREPGEPNIQGALVIQSMLRLSDPWNQTIVQSIQAQEVDQLLSLSRDPISSRVLDAFLESPSVLARDKRSFLLKLINHYHVLVDDRIGSRVGDRCWQHADPYLKERIAKSIQPHENTLAASYYGKYFARNLHLTMLKRDPAGWRDMQRNQKARVTNETSASTVPSTPLNSRIDEASKKRKRPATEPDEIDLLFAGGPAKGKVSVAKVALDPQPDVHVVLSSESHQVVDDELGQVLGAIKKVSKKEKRRKSKDS